MPSAAMAISYCISSEIFQPGLRINQFCLPVKNGWHSEHISTSYPDGRISLKRIATGTGNRGLFIVGVNILLHVVTTPSPKTILSR